MEVKFERLPSMISSDRIAKALDSMLTGATGFLLPALAESHRKRGIEEETVSSVLSEVKSRRKPSILVWTPSEANHALLR